VGVMIDDLKINYAVWGLSHHQTIVLLPGWGADLTIFQSVVPYLLKNYQVYVLDLPGFGKSAMPDKPLTITDYAIVITSFLRQQHIIRPVLIGHDFGGRIIMVMTGKLGFLAEGIVLVNSTGFKTKLLLGHYYWYYLAWYFKKIILRFKKNHQSSYLELLNKMMRVKKFNQLPIILKKTFIKVTKEDLRQYLKYIRCPTLLLWGYHDKTNPPSDASIMKKIIPQADLVILRTSGHYPYLDNLPTFLTVLTNFLNRI